MSRYFEDWTQEELSQYKDVFGDNLEFDEYDEACLILHQDSGEDIKFYKKNNSVWVECEEDEGMYDMNKETNTIYLYDRFWWYKVDMCQILTDYMEGVEIDPNEYRID